MNAYQGTIPRIVYSCYASGSRSGEQFVPEHILGYIVSGSLEINDGEQTFQFNAGDFRFLRRNHLAKFAKQPPPGGEFQSLSIFLDQQTLRNFSIEYGIKADRRVQAGGILPLNPTPLYQHYMDSLAPYTHLAEKENEALVGVKVKEAILLMLKENPELKNILFDFEEPGKINLEAFMNEHFRFNVEMKRFAYLTGRSLATFKRDFEKIFHISPSRWLLQRRLQEARYLIQERGQKPSDVYLEVGFEDLSHFSFAFKKAFGMPPSLASR